MKRASRTGCLWLVLAPSFGGWAGGCAGRQGMPIGDRWPLYHAVSV